MRRSKLGMRKGFRLSMKFRFYLNFTSTPNLSLQQVSFRSEQSPAFAMEHRNEVQKTLTPRPGCSNVE